MMNSLQLLHKIKRADLSVPFTIYFLIPYLAGLIVILKAILVPGCYGADMIDAGGHTLPNISAAHAILRLGQIPMVNIFNNFGTPLIGDGYTFPFSPLSLAYFIFPPLTAITLNRFAAAFLTVLVLTVYYRKRFSPFISSFCALAAFTFPGTLWHFATHHYQLSIFWGCCIFILQEKLSEKSRLRAYLLLYLAWLGLFLSTSQQLTLIVMVFAASQHLFLPGQKVRRALLSLAAMSSALIFVLPDLVSFVRNISMSQRMQMDYVMHLPADRIVKSVLGGFGGFKSSPDETFDWGWKDFHEMCLYFSIPLLTAVFIGQFRLWKSGQKRLFWQSVVLGVLSASGVLLLLFFPKLHLSIPLVNSTDITRFLWFSAIFLMHPAGEALESLRRGAWPLKEAVFIAVLSFMTIAGACFIVPWENVGFEYKLPVFFFALALLLALLAARRRTRQKAGRFFSLAAFGLMALSIFLTRAASALPIMGFHQWPLCGNTPWYGDIEVSDFFPKYFVPFMKPYSRLATDALSLYGQDIKAGRYEIFGSAGRSLMIDRRLARHFAEEGLIEFDDTNGSYHFSFKQPLNQEKIDTLGIRYAVKRGFDPALLSGGWIPLGEIGEIVLYENPKDVSIVSYFEGGMKQFVPAEKISFAPNGIRVELPEITNETELTAALHARAGWEAFAGGKPRSLRKGENGMISVGIRPGDRSLTLRYQPFLPVHFIMAVLISLFVCGGSWILVKRRFSHNLTPIEKSGSAES